ncbi:MAG: hypothetical protein NVS3B16_16050 [Vulcanimicrobiaceae bacterium]
MRWAKEADLPGRRARKPRGNRFGTVASTAVAGTARDGLEVWVMCEQAALRGAAAGERECA